MRSLPFVVFVALGLLVLAAGCKKKAPSPGPEPMPGPQPAGPGPTIDPSDPHAAAKTTFQQRCVRCHQSGGGVAGGPPAGGPPGRGMGRGPDLSKVAANPEHTRDWLAAHIRDPQAHKPESRMPKFAGQLSDDEIGKLADYLAGLK